MGDRVGCETCPYPGLTDELEAILNSPVGEAIFGEAQPVVAAQLAAERKLFESFAGACPRSASESEIRSREEQYEPDQIAVMVRSARTFSQSSDKEIADALRTERRNPERIALLLHALWADQPCDIEPHVAATAQRLTGLALRAGVIGKQIPSSEVE